MKMIQQISDAVSSVYSDDDQRMIRLQHGDSTAFGEIVSLWQSQLFGFFRRTTRDEHLSEDLVQETLLRLHKSSLDYLPNGRFKAFVFQIARNLVIDNSRRTINNVLIRSVKGNVSCNDSEERDMMQMVPDKAASQVDRAEANDLSEVVQEMLQELPAEQRQTFILHHYESMTLAEVADAMHTSLPTAKSRLRLVKEKLRDKLAHVA